MKGIILAGGLGSRLKPLTCITNKHLLPIYNKPMIYYPIEKLVQAGIKDILIVSGGTFAGDFLMLLGNGKEFGLKHINYTYQEGQGGIAEALGLAEHFSEGEKVAVILGDNIIENDITPYVNKFKKQDKGAKIFLKKVEHPGRFGVPRFKDKKIVSIDEKPNNPKSQYAVTGLYMYDPEVFNIVKTLKPSARGELEITDVNNRYIKDGTMSYEILKGFWSDAGTFESLYKSNELIRKKLIKEKKLKIK
ncbi:MAG: NTP transferase domain-containing protein [Candidatus Aureabacteria bacterium]|nr:NTP transferase domain-containing protein [Candidatus Auribacterota bacterium]